MHTFIFNTTLVILCHFDIYQPLKGHHQGVKPMHFNSKIDNVSYQM